jgi:eukaryotic-like serine/threonine-protein kinase
VATEESSDWIADYQVIRPLTSRNPMPRTYLAQGPGRLGGAGTQVALHLIDAEQARYNAAIAHLQAMAAARSPRMVGLIEAGRDTRDEAVAYYVTEFRSHGSLADQPPTGVAARLRALAQGARAVHDLHQAGEVHGDLGPESILLGDEAAIVVPRPPAPLEVGETIMANAPTRLETVDPAVIRGEGKSRATDLWALGVTIHLVLAGRSLHPGLSGDDPLTAVQRILFEPPAVDIHLPPQHQALISRCLHPNPEDRPASAEELAAELETLAAR